MYSDFIEDRLAQNSEYIAMLKKGITGFQPTWLENNFRSLIKYETLKPVDQFFDNLYHNYDENEKLFIYKSTYSQAGFQESIKNLEKFVPGFKVEITSTTFDYTPYLKFTKQNDGTYLSEEIEGYNSSTSANDKIRLTRNGETAEFALPYTQDSSRYVTYSTTYGDIPNPTGGITGQAIYINKSSGETPSCYISTVAVAGNKIELSIDNFSSTITTYVPDSSASQIEINQSLYWVNDTAAAQVMQRPMWFLNYRGSGASNVPSLRVYAGNDTANFGIIQQHSKHYLELSSTGESVLDPYMLKVSDGYLCLMNPVVLFGSGIPQTEFPQQKEGSSPPVYNITVSTTGEVFKDYELFQARFDYLVRELLFYYDEPAVTYYITFEVNAINNEVHQINMNPRNYQFAVISRDGLYPSQE